MIEYNINKILVPIDFSPGSLNALDTAVAMAKQHEATIILLNVVEVNGLSVDGNQVEETVLAVIHQSEKELQTLKYSIIEKFLVPCEVISTTGIVSSAIIKMSALHQADVIVMGTHGASGFRESFIGLNAFNVVKSAGCPVLTIPSQIKCDSFKKILFPVRPIQSALEKYDFVRKIVFKNNSTLKILALATDDENEIDLLKDLAWQLKDKLKADDLEATTYFKVGSNMADEVLKMASLMETDLVVITATIDSLFNQLFVGRYVQQILNHAHFPVLSVKPVNENVYGQSMQNKADFFARETPFYN